MDFIKHKFYCKDCLKYFSTKVVISENKKISMWCPYCGRVCYECVKPSKPCLFCGKMFKFIRNMDKYCSSKCRQSNKQLKHG